MAGFGFLKLLHLIQWFSFGIVGILVRSFVEVRIQIIYSADLRCCCFFRTTQLSSSSFMKVDFDCHFLIFS